MRTWHLALVISNTQSFNSNTQTFIANTLSFVVAWNLARPRMRIRKTNSRQIGAKVSCTFCTRRLFCVENEDRRSKTHWSKTRTHRFLARGELSGMAGEEWDFTKVFSAERNRCSLPVGYFCWHNLPTKISNKLPKVHFAIVLCTTLTISVTEVSKFFLSVIPHFKVSWPRCIYNWIVSLHYLLTLLSFIKQVESEFLSELKKVNSEGRVNY